jgi:hypothetical protein
MSGWFEEILGDRSDELHKENREWLRDLYDSPERLIAMADNPNLNITERGRRELRELAEDPRRREQIK